MRKTFFWGFLLCFLVIVVAWLSPRPGAVPPVVQQPQVASAQTNSTLSPPPSQLPEPAEPPPVKLPQVPPATNPSANLNSIQRLGYPDPFDIVDERLPSDSGGGTAFSEAPAVKLTTNGPVLTKATAKLISVTPEEREHIEAAFRDFFHRAGAWAEMNVVEEPQTSKTLARFYIPADPETHAKWHNALFASVEAIIGPERTGVLKNSFDYWRIYEDGAVAARGNLLELYKIDKEPGYGCRAGWLWKGSHAVNSFPEPIKPNTFPYAFRFIFPGGWSDLLRYEQLPVPPGF
jgi:hypothetical protein